MYFNNKYTLICTILLGALKSQLYHAIQQRKAANIVCFITHYLIQEQKENSYLLKIKK